MLTEKPSLPIIPAFAGLKIEKKYSPTNFLTNLLQ